MPHVSKRRKAITAKVDPRKSYAALEALNLVKQTATAKFDEAVDVAVNLGIDAKKGEQTVRGSGIGLFAARRLMNAMGGRVFIEPNGYASSRFVVALPAG